MKVSHIIIYCLLGLSVITCINYEDVELIGINNAEIISLTPNGATFKISATVNNPNDYNINLVTKDLKVYLNGKYLGTANFKDKVKLEKNSNKMYDVIVVSSIPSDGNIDIGTITASALLTGLNVKVEGDVKAMAKGISKTFPISFTEKVDL